MNSYTSADLYSAPLLNVEGLARDIGRLLVLAPHQDDESLGCGGLIALLKKATVPVHVIFMTDGSASHPQSITCPPAELAKVRRREALAACAHLGVPRENVSFLDEKDSQLSHLDPQKEASLIKFISHYLNLHNIQSLALPWRRDPL